MCCNLMFDTSNGVLDVGNTCAYWYFFCVRPPAPPYTKSHIATMEKIQRRAAHFVCNDYSRHASVTAMLDMLNWSSLEHRRKEAKCIMF